MKTQLEKVPKLPEANLFMRKIFSKLQNRHSSKALNVALNNENIRLPLPKNIIRAILVRKNGSKTSEGLVWMFDGDFADTCTENFC